MSKVEHKTDFWTHWWYHYLHAERCLLWTEVRRNRQQNIIAFWNYCQTSNISPTLVSYKIVDHADVVGASPDWGCSNYIFILDLTPGFNGLGRDNCKTKQESLIKFWDLVHLISDNLWKSEYCPCMSWKSYIQHDPFFEISLLALQMCWYQTKNWRLISWLVI